MRIRSLVLALTVFALLSASYFLPPTAAEWQKLEVLGTVLRFNLRGQQPMYDHFRILGITQQNISTLAKYGVQYPFPRDLHAIILRRLADAGAGRIAIDILFSEEGSWEPAEDAELREALVYYSIAGDPEFSTPILAGAVDVANIGGATVVSPVLPADTLVKDNPGSVVAFVNSEQRLGFKLQDQSRFDFSDIEPLGPRVWPLSMPAAVNSVWAYHHLHDREEYEPGADLPDRYMINYSCQPEEFPGTVYSLEVVLPEMFDSDHWKRLDNVRNVLKERVIAPYDLEGHLAAWETSGGQLPPEQANKLRHIFEHRVVFYGSRNPADNDFFSTPFGRMYGVDTIAQSAETLWLDKPIKSISNLAVAGIALLLAIVGWGAGLLRPMLRTVTLGVVVFLLIAAANMLAFVTEINVPFAYSTASFLFPFLACTIYGGSVEEAERRKIRATFGRYMSDELVAQLVEDPRLAHLGGQRIEVAVMFVDIRNYSTLTEHLDPQQTVWMLNTLLGELTEVIRANDGFVDKYLGDGLLACFGGPVPTRAPASDAVAAALEMLVVLHRDVNPKLAAVNLPELRIGIGIHYGPVVMGNIGSESRMEYTVVGDSVNVAARVESVTKELGWAVLVTREVTEAAPGFSFEPVGEQHVKGREQAVELYRPVYAGMEEQLKL